MICINNTCTQVYFNLAAEEYLLKNYEEDVFMLWQNEPSVIIGKHQDIYAEVNLDYAQEKGIKVARRFSGGGAVYHDAGNLNLTFIETRQNPDFNEYIRRIVSMLNTLGIHAYPDERRGLNVNGLKISGSAQSIHKNRVLFHATLLVSSDLSQLVTSLEASPENQRMSAREQRIRVRSVKSPVANLLSHLPKSMEIEEVKEFILHYFLSENLRNFKQAFSPADFSKILQLKEEKYGTKDWIYGIKSN